MNVLVTGGAGFIGANYIYYLLRERTDVKVFNLDKLTYAGNKETLAPLRNNDRYEFVKGDICDRKLVDSLMCQVDTVVNFAAESHVDRSIESPGIFLETNVIGTHTLLESALSNKVSRFHHVSTDEVFGSLSYGQKDIFTEKTPYNPRSPYSASKASSDHIVRAYYHTYDLPITITNCSNNYGPYQYPEKLLPLFITNLIEGRNLPLYGKGENVRDWIHVLDHVRGIQAVIEKGVVGETYCLGGGKEMRNIDIARMLIDIFEVDESVVEYVADRRGHDERYAIGYHKAMKEIGWEPELSFKEGLIDTVQWYKDHQSWWRPLKTLS